MSEPSQIAANEAASRTGITRFATRGHHRLSYEVHGADGAPALGLHDLLADRGQLHGLARVGSRLILPDARGHGASSTISARGYPLAELVADTLATLDAEQIAAADIVASGWGAATALALAAAAPERVRSLILVAPYLPALLADAAAPEAKEIGSEHAAALRAAAAAADRGQLDRAIDLVFAVRVGPEWREQVPKSQQGAARRSAANLAPILSGFLSMPDRVASWHSIAAPVTIVCADSAPFVIRMTCEHLTSLLTLARIVSDLTQAGEDAVTRDNPLLARVRATLGAAR